MCIGWMQDTAGSNAWLESEMDLLMSLGRHPHIVDAVGVAQSTRPGRMPQFFGYLMELLRGGDLYATIW